LGETGRNSTSDGIQQIRSLSADSPRENPIGSTSKSRASSPGKALQRLELIENAFLDYVREDQARMEARLAESKAKETSFLIAVAELKQEIHYLASKEDKSQSE